MALVNKSYDYSRIGGNVSGKNGMPSNVQGGGTYYINGVGTNASARGYERAADGSSGYSGGSSSSSRPRTSSGGGSSSSSSSSGYDYSDAYNALLAAYKNNDNDDYLRQMREAAENAYNRGMSNLNNAYNSQISSLSSNLGETRNQLANQYNLSRQNILDDAAASLKQAYINKMLSEKNLGQQMSAMGLTGGATETSLAGLLNNYGNARNNIYTTQNKNLSNLEGNYNTSLSQAMQAYNSAVADANLQKAQQAMTLENALANNQISAVNNYQGILQNRNSQYLDLLKAAMNNAAKFAYTSTKATNDVKAQATQQAYNETLVNNLIALEELMNTKGNNNAGYAYMSY